MSDTDPPRRNGFDLGKLAGPILAIAVAAGGALAVQQSLARELDSVRVRVDAQNAALYDAQREAALARQRIDSLEESRGTLAADVKEIRRDQAETLRRVDALCAAMGTRCTR